MRRTQWGAALLLSFVLTVASGCSLVNGETKQQAPGSLEIVKIGALSLIDTVPLYLAINNGFFAAEGLEVELSIGLKGSANVDNVIGGSLDLGLTSYPPAIAAHAKAKKLRIVNDAVQTKPNSVVLVVKENSPIKRVEDLVGKKIANSSQRGISELAMNSQFRIKGINPAADPTKVTYISSDFASMPTQLTNGTVDAAIIAEPFLTQALREGGSAKQPVVPLQDVFTGPTADFPWSGYVSTAEWVNTHRQTVNKIQTALRKGAELARGDREKVEQVLINQIKITPDIAKLVTVPDFPTSIEVTRIQRAVDLMKENGEVDANKNLIDVDVNTMMVGAV